MGIVVAGQGQAGGVQLPEKLRRGDLQHLAEPYLELHPQDATSLGVAPADLVQLSSRHGQVILRALISDATAPGTVFAPIHWTGETVAQARIAVLVPGVVNPVSGQPDSNAAGAAVQRFSAGC